MPTPVLLLVIPNLGKGGAQAVFRQQLVFYTERLQTIGVVFNMDGATDEDMKLGQILSLGVEAGNSWPGKLRSFIDRIRRLREIKRRYGVTISISHLEGADYVNWFSRQGERVICWIHGTKMHDAEINGVLGAFRKGILMRYVYNRCNHIVTVSERIADELRLNFRPRTGAIQTINNGLNVEFIQQQSLLPVEPAYRKLCEDCQVIITHARLARQKNFHALINIFSLMEERENVRLVILGDGEEMFSLIRHCDSLNLKARMFTDDHAEAEVVFMGHQGNPHRYLRLATLYALTSRWEGYPLSVCEAIISGLPVIASDCYTGPREILRPDLQQTSPVEQPTQAGCGILMPVPDNKAAEVMWAKTLSQVLRDDSQLWTWSDTASRMRSKFSIAKAEAEWLNLLK